MREVIERVRCDNCDDTSDNRDDIIEVGIAWNSGAARVADLCDPCQGLVTVTEMLGIGRDRKPTPVKKPPHSKKPSKADGIPESVMFSPTLDDKFLCIPCSNLGQTYESDTKRGARMHYIRSHVTKKE